MSVEAYVDFYENHVNSPAGEELRNQLAATQSGEEFLELVTESGKAAGFDFTQDEARDVMRASEAQMAKEIAEASGEELSDEDLEAVAGGVRFHTAAIPKVSIKAMSPPTFADKGQFEYRTVMCPW